MKKLIVLVLIIAIPFGLKFSESSKKSLLNRVETDGFSKQPKDSLWEYVKYEVSHGRINPKINYTERFKDPILVAVENASNKDSLALKGVMEELERIFPLKEVAYFSDFVGGELEPISQDNAGDKFVGYSYDELLSFTTKFLFNPDINYSSSSHNSYNLDDRGINVEHSRKNKWNRFFERVTLNFNIKDEVSIKERELFIGHHFYKSMWATHSTIIETTRPDFRRMQDYNLVYHRRNLYELADENYLKDDKFLIEKIFSNDFKEQFEDYMYKTYPWRYANLLIDKELAKQNATAMVVFMGLLILILSCSLFWNRKFKYSFLNYFLPMLIYTIGFLSLRELYAYLIHIDYPTNTISGIIGSLVFTGLFTLILSFLFWQIEKRIVPHKGSFGYQLLVKLGLTFLFLYLPYVLTIYFSESIVLSGGEITSSLNDLQFLFIVVGLTFGRGLLIYLNHFSESLVKEKDVELSRLKEVNAQSELKLLQSHINPHFLYNALNSIAGLAHNDADKTEQMALSLSDLFRYSINKKGEKMSTVSEEVTMVQNYLDIEKIRFGKRLKVVLTIDDTIKEEKIPMFMLQPLVENAIKHGISKIGGEGKISLEIKKVQQEFLITVSDNGPDFPKGLVSGHGLQTVYDLLRLSYGEDASLSWENTPTKQITISIKSNKV